MAGGTHISEQFLQCSRGHYNLWLDGGRNDAFSSSTTLDIATVVSMDRTVTSRYFKINSISWKIVGLLCGVMVLFRFLSIISPER